MAKAHNLNAQLRNININFTFRPLYFDSIKLKIIIYFRLKSNILIIYKHAICAILIAQWFLHIWNYFLENVVKRRAAFRGSQINLLHVTRLKWPQQWIFKKWQQMLFDLVKLHGAYTCMDVCLRVYVCICWYACGTNCVPQMDAHKSCVQQLFTHNWLNSKATRPT